MRVHPLLLLAFGLLAGLYVSDHLPQAQAAAGAWQCYVVDRLPDQKEAASWRGAKSTTEGLNAIAPGAPAGTVLSIQFPTAAAGFSGTQSDVALLCVKE